MTEAQIQKATLDLVNASGRARVYRQNTGRRGRVSFGLCVGSSDLIGWDLIGGRFVAIEIKVPGKEPDEAQAAFLEAVNRAGGIGIWGSDPLSIMAELQRRLRP